MNAMNNVLASKEPSVEKNTGFEPAFFPALARLESGNFWFRGRNKLILWALRTYAPRLRSFAEIGCGTGFVLSAVAKAFPGAEITGTELFPEAFEYAKARVPQASFECLNAKDIRQSNRFDCMGAFDVIEHIDDDDAVLENLAKALKPSGTLFITVPQHSWLWSSFDEVSSHERRYDPGKMEQKLAKHGFEIVRSSSFVFFLLPVMLLSRALKKRELETFDIEKELKQPPLVAFLLERLLDLELFLIKSGIDFPAGGSRMIVARLSAAAKKTGTNQGEKA